MRSRLAIRAACMFGLSGLLLAACEPPPGSPRQPGSDVVRAELALVQDGFVFTVVQVFELYVFKTITTEGGSVTCADFPTRFPIPDASNIGPLLIPVITPIQFAWTGTAEKEAQIESFEVPADEQLIFLVRGLARYGAGVQVVAQGCQRVEAFAVGSKNTVSIDAKATTGAACSIKAQCEANLDCQTVFTGGYCAKGGCTNDQGCPPGTACVIDPTNGGLCLRRCETVRDCAVVTPQAVQGCENRTGASGACTSVCVWPLWNTEKKCGSS